MTEPDPSRYSFWLASRSAGVVAFILIATAVILGLYMAGGVSKRPGAKRTLVKVHEQVALAALAAIAAHGLLLLGDKWLHPGVTGPQFSGQASICAGGSARGAGGRCTGRL